MNYSDWIECIHKTDSEDRNIVNSAYGKMRMFWNTDSGKTYHAYMEKLRCELEEQKRWKIKKMQ